MRNVYVTGSLALIWLTLGADATAHAQADNAGSDCVWSAVGGSLVGVSAAWYGFVGIEALRGRSAFDMESNARNIALVIGLETVGMVGGTMLACRLFSDEQRLWPTANSAIVGGVVGGVALGVASFALIKRSGLDADTDNPVRSALLSLLAISAGVAVGGYVGVKLDRAVRGAPAATISASPFMVGVGFRWN